VISTDITDVHRKISKRKPINTASEIGRMTERISRLANQHAMIKPGITPNSKYSVTAPQFLIVNPCKEPPTPDGAAIKEYVSSASRLSRAKA